MRDKNLMRNKKGERNKVYSTLLLIILSLLILIIYPRINMFLIRQVEEIEESEEVKAPQVGDGKEVIYLGYKYANKSGIIVSVEPYVSCTWLVEGDWKKCEVIFEIENQKQIKEILSFPEIELNFENSENIRNVEVTYSNTFIVEDEIYYTMKTEIVEKKNKQEKSKGKNNAEGVGVSISETGEKRLSKPMERKIAKLKDKRLSEEFAERAITKVVVRREEIHFKRRKFTDFLEFTHTAEKVIKKISENVSEQNYSSQNLTEQEGFAMEENISRQNLSEFKGEAVNMTNITGQNFTEPAFDISAKNNTKDLKSMIESISKEDNLTDSNSLISGFVIKTEESKDRQFSLDTDKPFAVKISFEIPKYKGNSFDFKILDKSFEAFIDPEISACGTLNIENAVYTLTQDVNSTGTCFTISANNVTLDCQGYEINYSSLGSVGYGIYSTANFTTIRNCIISKGNSSLLLDAGIFMLNSTSSRIYNNSILVSSGATFTSGIYLEASINNDVFNNTINISSNSSYAIYLYSSSSFVNITGNNIYALGNTGFGIYVIDDSNFTIIDRNNITTSGTGGYGIYVDCFSPSINNNLITVSGEDAYGILLESSLNASVVSNNISTFGIFSGNGIYMDEFLNSTINSNTIFTSGEEGYGIYLDSKSDYNTIISNIIETLADGSYGIYLFSGDYNNVDNNTIIISNAEEAFAISLGTDSGANTITNNNITTLGYSGYGIYFYGSNFNILSNNTISTSGASSPGLYIDTFSDNNFTGNTIVTSGNDSYGVFLHYANTVFFKYENITTNSYCIFINSQGNNITIEDSSLNAKVSNSDLLVNNGVSYGVWNFTNVSFDDKNWSITANGTLNVMWYFDILTNYSNGTTASNVNITVFDNTGVFRFSELTNSSGRISRKSLTEYIQTNSSSITYYSNYTVNASISSQALNQSVNITENKDMIFTFTGSSSDSRVQESPRVFSVGAGKCKPNWDCSVWSDCVDEKQTRTCENLNPNCNINKPIVKRGCRVNWSKGNREDVLFDIGLGIFNKTVSSGKLSGLIGLVNLRIPEGVNASLYYRILDSSGRIVYEETEMIFVEAQTEFTKEIDVSTLNEGDYTFLIDLAYEGQTEHAQIQDYFVIEKARLFVLNNGNFVFIIIIFAVFLCFWLLYRLRRVYKTKKLRKRRI